MMEFDGNLPTFQKKTLSAQTLKTEAVGLIEILVNLYWAI
jgi:hypothetical protein